MRLRAVIIEDEPLVRYTLEYLCGRRGYEVLAFSDPGLCPLYFRPPCPCPRGTACADLLLVDQYMPMVNGLNFVEGLRSKGCVALQIAAISGAWPPAARAHAVQLGCTIFPKPFAVADLFAWFDSVEVRVDPTRTLLDWRGEGWRIASSPPGP